MSRATWRESCGCVARREKDGREHIVERCHACRLLHERAQAQHALPFGEFLADFDPTE